VPTLIISTLADSAYVCAISQYLADHGVLTVLDPCFTAAERPPDSSAPSQLRSIVPLCSNVVALVSTASTISHRWHQAWESALSSQRVIYPVLLDRTRPDWLQSSQVPLIQDAFAVTHGSLPPRSWLDAVFTGSPWRRPTIPRSVIRAAFSIAWPIWAGGYPTVDVALATARGQLSSWREVLVDILARLGTGWVILEVACTAGGYRPIEGLEPKSLTQNSLEIEVLLDGADQALNVTAVWAGISQVCAFFSNILQSTVEAEMPGALLGANVYDAAYRWYAPSSFSPEPTSGDPPGPLLRFTLLDGHESEFAWVLLDEWVGGRLEEDPRTGQILRQGGNVGLEVEAWPMVSLQTGLPFFPEVDPWDEPEVDSGSGNDDGSSVSVPADQLTRWLQELTVIGANGELSGLESAVRVGATFAVPLYTSPSEAVLALRNGIPFPELVRGAIVDISAEAAAVAELALLANTTPSLDAERDSRVISALRDATERT
jgi:hypothetical protein